MSADKPVRMEHATSAGVAHRLIVCAIRDARAGFSTAIAGRDDAYWQAKHIIEAANAGWHHLKASDVAALQCDDESQTLRHSNGSKIIFTNAARRTA